ncbi:MAG: DsbA family protein, partial [Myxococcales bacterium]|nr:DsbA family protein [Myxococcales bacterium]
MRLAMTERVPSSSPFLRVGLVACFVILAGCGDSEPAPVEAPIERLDGIALEGLSSRQRRLWIELVNDRTSPCGQPVSVARCVDEGVPCGRCRTAARYIARLVALDVPRRAIGDLFRLRFGRDTEFQIAVDDSPMRGAAMAPLTIVEYSDFECPHCRMARPELERIVSDLEGRVRLVFKHYPLSGHEHAMEAACAAIAAGNQGKFWQMHDLLFEHQDALESADLEIYAERLGLQMDRFRADLEAEETLAKVRADKEEGRENG